MKKLFTLFLILFACHYTFAQWEQKGNTLEGSSSFQHFGQSLALNDSANVMVIGSSGSDDEAGRVDVYRLINDSWQQMGNTIFGEIGDGIGSSVDVNGDGRVIVVGSIYFGNTGKVDIYHFDEGADLWVLDRSFQSTLGGGRLGYSVEINKAGDQLVAGAPYASVMDMEDVGAIFQYAVGEDGIWQQTAPPYYGNGEMEYFGFSVSINRARFAVGAPGGHYVSVFNWDPGMEEWVADTTMFGDVDSFYGSDISLRYNTIAIGAVSADIDGMTDVGMVEIREWNGSIWEVDGLIEGDSVSTNFGRTLALNDLGNTLIIGAGEDEFIDLIPRDRLVRVYQYDGDEMEWNQLGDDFVSDKIVPVDISLDKMDIAIGTPYAEVNSEQEAGQVLTYRYVTPGSYLTIHDQNFEQALVDLGIDSEGSIDGRVRLSDVQNLTNLDVSYFAIKDLSGIEGFTALEILDVSGNGLSSLNLNNNDKLVSLNCSNNTISNLQLPSVKKLATFDGSNNAFTNLNLRGFPLLETVNLQGNSDLSCVMVDNPLHARYGEEGYADWLEDDASVYKSSCLSAFSMNRMTISNENEGSAFVYPNPATNSITVKSSTGAEVVKTIIYNFSGEFLLSSTSPKIDVKSFKKGIYHVEVFTEDGESHQEKLIIE